jgi:hypothetical protein
MIDEHDLYGEILRKNQIRIDPELKKALIAIAEGYPVTVEDDRYILVENPRYTDENVEDPNLMIDTWMFE